MTVACAVLVPAPPGTASVRGDRRARPARATERQPTSLGAAAAMIDAALAAGCDEVIVVVASESLAASVAEGATVLLDDAPLPNEASAARVATDWAAREGHGVLVLCYDPIAAAPGAARPELWRALAEHEDSGGAAMVVVTRRATPVGIARLEATAWSLLPLAGRIDGLFRARHELVAELEVDQVLEGP